VFTMNVVMGFLKKFTLLNSLRKDVLHICIVRRTKGKSYAGFTQDLKLRFERHNKGFVGFTKDRKPLQLIYYEACIFKDDATKKEKYFKTSWKKMFLKNQLKSYLTG
jgi:putative endonuclease